MLEHAAPIDAVTKIFNPQECRPCSAGGKQIDRSSVQQKCPS